MLWMMKFRKKPVVIEAIQLPLIDEDAPQYLIDWLHKFDSQWSSDRDGGLIIYTLEGEMRANPGDWIIKGVKGEMYPCKPDIFAATYEALERDD
jgi:hypothetical protein